MKKKKHTAWLRLLPAPVRARLRARLNRFERPVAILAYHRVIDLPSDPLLLSVTPAHFAEHLKLIRKHAQPIPLDLVPYTAGFDFSSSPCVAVTFDDGYFDNLEFAKPILDRHGVVTGNVDSGREFWWDALERFLLLPRQLPPYLDWETGGSVRRWNFISDRNATDLSWNVLRAPACDRQRAYLTLMGDLSRCAPAKRDVALARLTEWSGQSGAGRDVSRGIMTGAELRTLRAGGLVSLGAHTHAHPMLAQLMPAQQRAEIEASKRWLEQQFGDPVTSFAYPFGTRESYNRSTSRFVWQAGFEHACSTAARTVSALDDPFELPRFTVRDWSATEFESRLKGWLRL